MPLPKSTFVQVHITTPRTPREEHANLSTSPPRASRTMADRKSKQTAEQKGTEIVMRSVLAGKYMEVARKCNAIFDKLGHGAKLEPWVRDIFAPEYIEIKKGIVEDPEMPDFMQAVLCAAANAEGIMKLNLIVLSTEYSKLLVKRAEQLQKECLKVTSDEDFAALQITAKGTESDGDADLLALQTRQRAALLATSKPDELPERLRDLMKSYIAVIHVMQNAINGQGGDALGRALQSTVPIICDNSIAGLGANCIAVVAAVQHLLEEAGVAERPGFARAATRNLQVAKPAVGPQREVKIVCCSVM